jgi:hypothetical protein
MNKDIVMKDEISHDVLKKIVQMRLNNNKILEGLEKDLNYKLENNISTNSAIDIYLSVMADINIFEMMRFCRQ